MDPLAREKNDKNGSKARQLLIQAPASVPPQLLSGFGREVSVLRTWIT